MLVESVASGLVEHPPDGIPRSASVIRTLPPMWMLMVLLPSTRCPSPALFLLLLPRRCRERLARQAVEGTAAAVWAMPLGSAWWRRRRCRRPPSRDKGHSGLLVFDEALRELLHPGAQPQPASSRRTES